MRSFFLGVGGKRPAIFWIAYIGLALAGGFTDSFGPWWLGRWAAQYETHLPNEVSVS